MKKKLFLVTLLLLSCSLLLSGCGKKDEGSKEKESEETIVTEEITEGIVDGYKFKEVDEITNRVKIQMQNGDIILIVLSNSDTPITIANFQKLVSEQFYDGLIFHRVIEGFMVQTGDPTGTGYYGSDENIKGEFSSNGVENNLTHTRGVVSMARSDNPNSASSQFFIVHEDSPHLNGDYAAFGRVFAGMDAIDKIASVETDVYDKPLKEQKIHSIRFIEVEKVS